MENQETGKISPTAHLVAEESRMQEAKAKIDEMVKAEAVEEPAPAAEPEPNVVATSEEPATPQENARLSSKLAELARKDRELKQAAQRLKAEEKKIKAYENLEESIKNDPIGVLQQFNVDILKVLDQAVADKPKEDPRLSKVELLEKKLEAFEKAQTQQQQQAIYTKTVNDIYSIASSDAERYEAVLERVDSGSMDYVLGALDEMYQQTGVLPTRSDYKQALDLVEQVYREQEFEELKKRAASKRLGGRFQLLDEKANTLKSNPTIKQPVKTLSNKLQSEAPQRSKPQTDEERLALAIKIAEEHDFKL